MAVAFNPYKPYALIIFLFLLVTPSKHSLTNLFHISGEVDLAPSFSGAGGPINTLTV